MKVLETRKRADGAITRRRLLPSGRAITTLEVPMSVIRALGAADVAEALARWNRGEVKRESAALLRAQVAERSGWKATAVAHELGCTEARVRQIRAEL